MNILETLIFAVLGEAGKDQSRDAVVQPGMVKRVERGFCKRSSAMCKIDARQAVAWRRKGYRKIQID